MIRKKCNKRLVQLCVALLFVFAYNPNKSQLKRQPTFEYSPIESDEEDESAYAEPLSDSGQVRM